MVAGDDVAGAKSRASVTLALVDDRREEGELSVLGLLSAHDLTQHRCIRKFPCQKVDTRFEAEEVSPQS